MASGLAAQHAAGDARHRLGRQAHGAGDAFARTAFRAAFAEGADLGDPATLITIADRAGLPADDLAAGIADPAVKDALRAATDAAIALGVRGVPTLALDDGRLLFGDDRLRRGPRSAILRAPR